MTLRYCLFFNLLSKIGTLAWKVSEIKVQKETFYGALALEPSKGVLENSKSPLENQYWVKTDELLTFLFGSSNKLSKMIRLVYNFHVSYEDHNIQPSHSVKYLGLTNSYLERYGWFDSIHYSEFHYRLEFLYRHSNFFNWKLRRDRSFLIQCHILFSCLALWFDSSKIYLQKLQVIQNKVVRFILYLPESTISQFLRYTK